MRGLAGGIVQGATAGAAAAFVTAWFLPWMAGASAFPLIGHGFTMYYWFLFDPPGPGAALELAVFGLLGLTAIVSGFLSAPWTSGATAVVAAAIGVLLTLRDHPGLSSGIGAAVAAAGMVVLAVAQITSIWRTTTGWRPAVAGLAAAAMLAVAAGFGGAAFASARDVDATTSKAFTPVVLAQQDGPLSGITARDAATGAERWHHWERGWSAPEVALSPDGVIAYLEVYIGGRRDALAFAASTGSLVWQKQVAATGHWATRPDDIFIPTYSADRHLLVGPGLVQDAGWGTVRYLDASWGTVRYLDESGGVDGTIRLDAGCGSVVGAGGTMELYLVEHCDDAVKVLNVNRNLTRGWSATVYPSLLSQVHATVDEKDDPDQVVVVTVNGTTTTFDALTGKPRN